MSTGPVWRLSRPVAWKFGGWIGVQRLIVTGVEAAVPACPVVSSGSAPTWYVPSNTYGAPVGATHLLRFGEPGEVSIVGAGSAQVNDHELAEPVQVVVAGGHVSCGVPSMSHVTDPGLFVVVA